MVGGYPVRLRFFNFCKLGKITPKCAELLVVELLVFTAIVKLGFEKRNLPYPG